MKNRLKAVYRLMCGQCSKAMRSKLHSLPVFNKARDKYDIIAFIKLIQGATFNFEKHSYLYDSLNNIQQNNRRFFQQQGWNLMDYLEK